MKELSWQIFHNLFHFLLCLTHFLCVFVCLSEKRELGHCSRRRSATLCFFSIQWLARCPGNLFHDSLLEWHICHFQFTLRAFAYVCASVRVCWRVGVPAEQFPLMRKARRRYLGDVMKDLEGNIVGSFQRELIINVYSLKVFRSSAGRSMCQCVRTCVCMYVCVYVCKYKG